MVDYRLTGGYYLLPTPKGAFQALIHPYRNPPQQLVLKLLEERHSVFVNPDSVKSLLDTQDHASALRIVHEAQSAGWIEGFEHVKWLPNRPVVQSLEKCLAVLSSSGQALIADLNGCPVASSGFDTARCKRLSVLAAELAVIHSRHADYLAYNMSIDQQGWGLIDTLGSSKIATWVLHTQRSRFVLLIHGMPNLNHKEFVTLAWILVHRYRT